jgi:hypothetical protein
MGTGRLADHFAENVRGHAVDFRAGIQRGLFKVKAVRAIEVAIRPGRFDQDRSQGFRFNWLDHRQFHRF